MQPVQQIRFINYKNSNITSKVDIEEWERRLPKKNK